MLREFSGRNSDHGRRSIAATRHQHIHCEEDSEHDAGHDEKWRRPRGPRCEVSRSKHLTQKLLHFCLLAPPASVLPYVGYGALSVISVKLITQPKENWPAPEGGARDAQDRAAQLIADNIRARLSSPCLAGSRRSASVADGTLAIKCATRHRGDDDRLHRAFKDSWLDWAAVLPAVSPAA
jgi:hypothetical protein